MIIGVLTSGDLVEGSCLCCLASLIEPLWVEFSTLIGVDERPTFSPTHTWGCHRRRVPDRVVFDHVIAALALIIREGESCGFRFSKWILS